MTNGLGAKSFYSTVTYIMCLQHVRGSIRVHLWRNASLCLSFVSARVHITNNGLTPSWPGAVGHGWSDTGKTGSMRTCSNSFSFTVWCVSNSGGGYVFTFNCRTLFCCPPFPQTWVRLVSAFEHIFSSLILRVSIVAQSSSNFLSNCDITNHVLLIKVN